MTGRARRSCRRSLKPCRSKRRAATSPSVSSPEATSRKIVVGKALESHPKILLLDDPTYGVDIHAKGDITAAITRFTDAGGGVVFVSSELTEMIENCDRILLIKYNRIVGELRDVPRLGLTEDSLMAAIQ